MKRKLCFIMDGCVLEGDLAIKFTQEVIEPLIKDSYVSTKTNKDNDTCSLFISLDGELSEKVISNIKSSAIEFFERNNIKYASCYKQPYFT